MGSAGAYSTTTAYLSNSNTIWAVFKNTDHLYKTADGEIPNTTTYFVSQENLEKFIPALEGKLKTIAISALRSIDSWKTDNRAKLALAA